MKITRLMTVMIVMMAVLVLLTGRDGGEGGNCDNASEEAVNTPPGRQLDIEPRILRQWMEALNAFQSGLASWLTNGSVVIQQEW